MFGFISFFKNIFEVKTKKGNFLNIFEKKNYSS